MLLISQHARLLNVPMPKDAVFRVNAAWVKDKEELIELIENIKGDVFLDFPEGRSKPPKPTLKLDELIEVINLFSKIKYFAITNVKTGLQIDWLRKALPHTVLVPKIESADGVDNITDIFSSMRRTEKYLMFDKEDLYTDLNGGNGMFVRYVETLRAKCIEYNKQLLELQGVIFASDSYLRGSK